MLVTTSPEARAFKLKELEKYAEQARRGELTTVGLLGKLQRTNAEVDLDKFITADPDMLSLKSKIMAIQTTSNHYSVLITGPSGTGKELLAKSFIRNKDPFIARNCAGIPKELVSSLFFGHMRGTFTGADSDKHGILVQAGEGVVFLDEIADFPLELQATLLRAMQERVITRLGSVEEIPIKCRFIAATKFDLREMIAQGKFREDLFARLFDFELRTKGLKDRPEDIPLIAKDGLDKSGKTLNWTDPIPPHALPDIYQFNVRGIQKFVMEERTFGYAR